MDGLLCSPEGPALGVSRQCRAGLDADGPVVVSSYISRKERERASRGFSKGYGLALSVLAPHLTPRHTAANGQPFYVVTTNRVGSVHMSVNASGVLSRQANTDERSAG
jgi:hypothetical protein